ncbi:MAG: hypothetical protein Q7R34_06310 [Dehalococcoidia bacterium]|nr:hypothetical protein [Dehalococcoidia bacterium]
MPDNKYTWIGIHNGRIVAATMDGHTETDNDLADFVRQGYRIEKVGATIIIGSHWPPEFNLPQPLSEPVVRGYAEVLKSLDCHGNIRQENSGIKAALVQLEQDTREADIETVRGVMDNNTDHLAYTRACNDIIAALKGKVRE